MALFNDKTPLSRSDIEAIARQAAEEVYKERGTQYGVPTVPYHIHNGIDSPEITQTNILPGYRALATITMATDGATYTLGGNAGGTQLLFYGTAVHNSGGVDMRAICTGNCQLGQSYKFVAQSGTSVTTGDHALSLIQGSSALFIDSSGASPVFRVWASEENLVFVKDASSAEVAVATVQDFGDGFIRVKATLATDWSIVGTFVVI